LTPVVVEAIHTPTSKNGVQTIFFRQRNVPRQLVSNNSYKLRRNLKLTITTATGGKAPHKTENDNIILGHSDMELGVSLHHVAMEFVAVIENRMKKLTNQE
jgi:hypothetical protein